MELLLTRHGETDWNTQKRIQGSTDTPLNENGIRQAEELAARLLADSIHPARIYSSSLERAFTTAGILSRSLNIPCVPFPGLEEISFGLWEGLTWDQVRAQYPAEYELWHQNRRTQQPPRGESYQELLDRVLPALSQIIHKEGGASSPAKILVVSHSAIIMSVLAFLNHTPFSEMAARYRTKNAGIIHLDAGLLLSASE